MKFSVYQREREREREPSELGEVEVETTKLFLRLTYFLPKKIENSKSFLPNLFASSS